MDKTIWPPQLGPIAGIYRAYAQEIDANFKSNIIYQLLKPLNQNFLAGPKGQQNFNN